MTAILPFAKAPRRRDVLWEHCRNSLGIARLLVEEDRPEAFVATACHLAVESACRAALSQAGLRFDGDVERALGALAAPLDLHPARDSGGNSQRLAATERVIAWVAAYLRSEAPERSWEF